MTYHSTELLLNWDKLTLAERLGNVGGEVSRMLSWSGRDSAVAERAFERMLELLGATIATEKSNLSRLRELTRLRELIVSDWQTDKKDLEWANQYLLIFARLARKNRMV